MTPNHRFEKLLLGLDAFIDQARRETGVPGIGIAISVAGRRAFAGSGTLAAGAAEPLTAGARFQLGCIMKLLLAMAALELATRGTLDLDAPLGEYLPELRSARGRDGILVRHLLSHTSGYQGTDILDAAARGLTWETFVDYLHAAPQFFRPGTVFNYEHSEAVLLERILERAAGEDSVRLVRRIVLEPLGCSAPLPARDCAAAIRVVDHRYDGRLARFVADAMPEPSAFWSAAFSSRTLTLGELLAMAEALAGVSGASLEGGLSASSVRAARERAVALPPMVGGPLRELLPKAFGHGTAILKGGYFGSTGIAGGQCVGLRFDPAEQIAVAVGLNAFVPHLRDLILATVCASLKEPQGGESTEPPPIALAELAGVYRGNGGKVVYAERRNGRLLCAIGHDKTPHTLKAELEADDEGRWTLHSPAPHLSVGALREPGSGAPVLMVGLSALKRIEPGACQAYA